MQIEDSGWRLRLFGRVELTGPTDVISNFGTSRAAKLFVLLALSRSGEMQRTQLADLLWPDDFYDSTRLRLRQEIHRLKRALEPAGDWISASTNSVSLDRSQLVIDLHALGRLDGKCPLPEGEFLPGWDDAWAVSERRNAEDIRVRAAIATATQKLELGNTQAALAAVSPLIDRHPLHEALRMTAVQAHARGGSLAAAVAEYQDYRKHLKEQLGREPSAAAMAAIQALEVGSPVMENSPVTSWPRLPDPTEEIIGRTELIARTETTLENSRWASLTGPGGIGKTRIAYEVAGRSRIRAAFVSLAELAANGDWVHSTLGQLGIDSPGQDNDQHFLASILNSEPTLLVLDNAENLPTGQRGQITQLLKAAPLVHILTTATHPLRQEGETVIAVGPLEDNGIELLMATARRVRPLVMNQPDSVEMLAEVAKRLDGYPLALRLAAARLRLLSPTQLLGSLDRLDGTDSRLPERHRSLLSALSSSIEALSADGRELLTRIAIFPGGLGMDFAERVLGDLNYLMLLEQLLDAALVNLDEEANPVRLRLLGPVREYVRGSLASQEIARRETEMLSHCSLWLREIGTGPDAPMTQPVFDALNSETSNLLAALELAITSEPDLAVEMAAALHRQQIARGRAWDFALSLERIDQSAVSPGCITDLLLTIAALHIGAYREDRVPELLERATAAGLDLNQFARYQILTAFCAFRRHFDRDESFHVVALEAAQASGNEYLIGQAHFLSAMVAIYRQDPPSGIRHLSIAFDVFRSLKANFDAGDAGLRLAFQLWTAGRRDESRAVLDEARSLLANSRNPVRLALMHETIGRLALASNRAAEAEPDFREALRIWTAIGTAYQEADQWLSLTRALLAQHKWPEARRALVASAEGWVADNNLGGIAQSLTSLAILLDVDGRSTEAREVLGYSRTLQTVHRLSLVKPEEEFRDEVAARLGGYLESDRETTLIAARKWFDEIR